MVAWLRVLAMLVAAVVLGVLFRAYPGLAPIVAIGGGIAFSVWWYRARPQHKSTPLEARRLGLEYAREDRLGIAGYPLELLRRGEEREVEHVLWGPWKGMPVTLFDLSYALMAGAVGTRTRLTCALTQGPIDCPPVVIESIDLTPGSLEFEQAPPLEGPAELSERYRVLSGDAAVARSLVDGGMSAFLIGLSGPWGFELNGRTVLCYGPWRERWDLFPLLSALQSFCARIPAEFRRRHPAPAGAPAVAETSTPPQPWSGDPRASTPTEPSD